MSHFRFPDGVEYAAALATRCASTSACLPMRMGTSAANAPIAARSSEFQPTTTTRFPTTSPYGASIVATPTTIVSSSLNGRLERATRAAHDYASQLVGRMLDESFGGMARRSRSNSFVKISYRSTRFSPEPLPGINEESLIRERICERCRLHYPVYGEHRFCPVCGPLPAMTVALDAIAADETRLVALANLPAEALGPLRESGVLDRTYADTIENVIGTVETLVEKTFHELVPSAAALLRGRGKFVRWGAGC